ncbi:MAG: hypothetical protein K2I51_05515, partial [Muribaculaceae bacterium]|nr:hypothetical protein [Muribaculaceae bacterium]
YVYCADLRLENGSTSTISLNRKRYDSLHKGDSVGIVVCRGFLGWEELRTDSIKYPAQHRKKNRRRNFPRRRPSHKERM